MKALEVAAKLDAARMEHWGMNAPIYKPVLMHASAELRRLAEVNAELVEVLGKLDSAFMAHTRWNGEPPVEITQARAAASKAKEQQ